MKLKAILFDLDGTLRDTREVIFPSFEHALKQHIGKAPSRADMIPHVHYHRAIHKKFAPEIDYAKFRATYMGMLDELRGKTFAYEGSSGVIQTLHTAGYRLGIITSAPSAIDYLSDQGIEKYFDVVVGGDDVKEQKPSPVPIIHALKALGLKPKDAVMVGDLQVDITAAKAAGLRAAIGITHGFGTLEMLTSAGADYIINSLDELVEVIGKIEAK